MNSRALVAIMLVGAFAAAPNAMAEPLVSVNVEPLEIPELLETVPADSALAVAGGIVATIKGLEPVAQVEQLLTCEASVKLPISIFGGYLVDTRTSELSTVVRQATVLDQVVRLVPVMGTVTEVVWQGTGLLSALPAITREVTGVVGYDEELVPTQEEDLDYQISLKWRDSQVAWERTDFEILLKLPAGLQFLDDGRGTLYRACEGETVLPEVPTFSAFEDYDYLKVVLGGSERGDHTAWYRHILDVNVQLTDADATGARFWNDCGVAIGSRDLVRTAERALQLYQDRITRGEIEVPEPAIAGQAAPEQVEPAAGSATGVAASNLVAVAAASILGAVAVAFGLRRFLS